MIIPDDIELTPEERDALRHFSAEVVQTALARVVESDAYQAAGTQALRDELALHVAERIRAAIRAALATSETMPDAKSLVQEALGVVASISVVQRYLRTPDPAARRALWAAHRETLERYFPGASPADLERIRAGGR